MNAKQRIALEKHFLDQHKNPPPPFNQDYDPKAKGRSSRVAQSMEADSYYAFHSRAECAAEFRRRYAVLTEQESVQ